MSTETECKKMEKLAGRDSSQVDIREVRLTLRPIHKSVGASNRTDYSNRLSTTGMDYSPTMPNAFVPPVYFFYFILKLEQLCSRAKVQ
jgi:hypothetical protein